jgi:hypothetical protein
LEKLAEVAVGLEDGEFLQLVGWRWGGELVSGEDFGWIDGSLTSLCKERKSRALWKQKVARRNPHCAKGHIMKHKKHLGDRKQDKINCFPNNSYILQVFRSVPARQFLALWFSLFR